MSEKNYFYIFVPSAVFPLNLKFQRLSYFKKIGGSAARDGRTDRGGATLNSAPREDRII